MICKWHGEVFTIDSVNVEIQHARVLDLRVMRRHLE